MRGYQNSQKVADMLAYGAEDSISHSENAAGHKQQQQQKSSLHTGKPQHIALSNADALEAKSFAQIPPLESHENSEIPKNNAFQFKDEFETDGQTSLLFKKYNALTGQQQNSIHSEQDEP